MGCLTTVQHYFQLDYFRNMSVCLQVVLYQEATIKKQLNAPNLVFLPHDVVSKAITSPIQHIDRHIKNSYSRSMYTGLKFSVTKYRLMEMIAL